MNAATQKQWRAKEERALRSPVARAIAKREIQELHRQVQEVALVCLAVEHGTEQRELLANLAFMILKPAVTPSPTALPEGLADQ